MIKRRTIFKGIAATAVGSPILPVTAQASSNKKALKRIIFFLQNQGFDPHTAIPKDLNESASLDSFNFEEPIKELEPLKDKIHIINGLHGLHTSPSRADWWLPRRNWKSSSRPHYRSCNKPALTKNHITSPVHRYGFFAKHAIKTNSSNTFRKRCRQTYFHAFEPSRFIPVSFS